MGYREMLVASDATLSDAERRISGVLLADPYAAPLMTAADVATRASVHESTVVRFAQKLGYAGFSALRKDLATDSLQRSSRGRPQPSETEASLAKVARAQAALLAELEDHVDQGEIDAAMRKVSGARHVFVLGDGLVGPLADFFARKVALLGLPATAVRQSAGELGIQLRTIGTGDVVVVFVLASEYDAMRDGLDTLLDRGVQVILVTDEPVLAQRPRADHVLAVPRSPLNHGVFVSLATVGYALDYALMQLLGPPSPE